MKQTLPSILVAGALVGAVELDDDGAPKRRVKLLPMGEIRMRDGRGPYKLDDLAHAKAVVAATQQWLGGVDFNFDYDHQALHAIKPGAGGTAPASGWVKPENLTAEADGIYANEVDWTPAGDAALRAKEYRYTSPVFYAGPDKRVLRLKNAALTSNPAIDLPAIAATTSESENTMLTAIAAALGLADTADEAAIVAAIGTMKASTSAIAVAAGLAEDAAGELVAATVTDLKKAGDPDPKRFVPIEVVAATTARLNKLEGERHERIVQGAIKELKLAPALKKWGLDLIAANEESWDAWYASAVPVIAPGETEKARIQPATTLTADEIAACEMTGMSHEDFLAAKNAEIA